jgi:hypothetical protein
MQKKMIATLLAVISVQVMAADKSIPTLATDWKGQVTVTSFGAVSKGNPNHKSNVGEERAAKGWNTFTASRFLKVVKQDGRHLDLLVGESEGKGAAFVGTISADGKEIYIVNRQTEGALKFQGKSLVGCGSTRTGELGQDGLPVSYLAWCKEFSPVK